MFCLGTSIDLGNGARGREDTPHRMAGTFRGSYAGWVVPRAICYKINMLFVYEAGFVTFAEELSQRGRKST